MSSHKGRHPTTPPFPKGVHSPRVHLELYSLLLVATPFVMLRVFMQDAIGRLSASTFRLGRWAVPWVPVIAGALILELIVVFRRRITRRVLLAGGIGICMFGLGQKLTDHYFGHRFYELQQNWHYIAYSLFALMVRRDLLPRGVSEARCALVSFGLAAVYSAFDEGFQLFLNNRVFDMSDIGKDVWGTVTGITMLLVASRSRDFGHEAWKRVRQPTFGKYLRHLPSVWLLLVVLAFLFLSYSSLLTELGYWSTILVFTFGSFAAFFVLLHWSQYRWFGRALIAAGALGLVLLAGSIARYHDAGIVRARYGLTVYRGIPLPFFDVMVFPGGGFRLIDKKHAFNARDRTFIDRKKVDIVLIGTGFRGLGGRGFPHLNGSRFLYNAFSHRGSQVIILRTPEACDYFNRATKAGKHVLFILHSTC
jgi:hypothetical protein